MHFIIKISGPKKIQSNSRIGVYTPSNHPKALFTAATTAFLKASDGVPVSTPVTTTQSDVLLLRRIQLQSLKPQKLHRSSVQLCRCDPWSEGNYICTSSHLQFHPHRYSTLDTMGRGRFHQSMTLWHPGMLSQRSTTKQEFRSPVGSVQSGFLKLRVFQISVSLPRTWNGWESKIPPWVSFIGSKVTVCCTALVWMWSDGCGPLCSSPFSRRLSAGDQERGCQHAGPAADPARAKWSKFKDFQQQASAFLKVRNETLEIKLVKISVLGGRIRLLLE